MRSLTFLLTLLLCFTFLGLGTQACDTICSKHGKSLNLLGGTSIYVQSYENVDKVLFKNEIGYTIGLTYTFTRYLGGAVFYDNIRAEFVGKKTHKNDLSVYGLVTLLKTKYFMTQGLVGVEWADNTISHFDLCTPGFSFGLLGDLTIKGRFSLYGTVTTAMAADFTSVKVRSGLSFNLF